MVGDLTNGYIPPSPGFFRVNDEADTKTLINVFENLDLWVKRHKKKNSK